jgi:hypothetical protein
LGTNVSEEPASFVFMLQEVVSAAASRNVLFLCTLQRLHKIINTADFNVFEYSECSWKPRAFTFRVGII